MLTLYLLRHAKSSWDDPSTSDFERPLAARGREAAPRMARHMRDTGHTPQLVLCSPAARARETMDLVVGVLNGDPEIRMVDGLYNFGDGTGLLHIIQKAADDHDRVMVIGHNPSLESLALKLASTGKSVDLTDMARKFPTAALAILEFEVGAWRDIRPGKGKLVAFTKPKALHEA